MWGMYTGYGHLQGPCSRRLGVLVGERRLRLMVILSGGVCGGCGCWVDDGIGVMQCVGVIIYY